MSKKYDIRFVIIGIGVLFVALISLLLAKKED